MLRAIQITTFLQSFYFSLFILAFAPEIVTVYPFPSQPILQFFLFDFSSVPASASWIVLIVSVLPPIISVVLLMPQIFPVSFFIYFVV